MNKPKKTINKHVFREVENGDLEFVGDFDRLYLVEDDPWSQSGDDVQWKDYYEFSRSNIVDAVIQNCQKGPILEVGCGTGYVVEFLSKRLPALTIDGMDISGVAIKRAKQNFPGYQFFQHDITVSQLPGYKEYEIVILNQLLWYILNGLENAIFNCHNLIRHDGFLIISQSFLKEKQRYGAEIVDGCDGLLEFIANKFEDEFLLTNVQYDDSDKYLHHDGLLILKKMVA